MWMYFTTQIDRYKQTKAWSQHFSHEQQLNIVKQILMVLRHSIQRGSSSLTIKTKILISARNTFYTFATLNKSSLIKVRTSLCFNLTAPLFHETIPLSHRLIERKKEKLKHKSLPLFAKLVLLKLLLNIWMMLLHNYCKKFQKFFFLIKFSMICFAKPVVCLVDQKCFISNVI